MKKRRWGRFIRLSKLFFGLECKDWPLFGRPFFKIKFFKMHSKNLLGLVYFIIGFDLQLLLSSGKRIFFIGLWYPHIHGYSFKNVF